ncbi:MAG: RnfABCDGE type electron transport complex subunit D [Deltaproteobacteria bacterium]|nr:RnfABCDGE type electron transport complex subunit D [Deltaproteobacteria bacterium]
MSDEKLLTLSSSPHIRDGSSVTSVMHTVVLALSPGAATGVYLFGLPALATIILAIASSVALEAWMQWVMGRKITIFDGSAILTGLLLAMNLPSSSPWWITVTGSAVAIIVGKHLYGGLGQNIFNPALVARVFLLISWPVQMTSFPAPSALLAKGVDAVSTATPLTNIKMELMSHKANIDITQLPQPSTFDLLLGVHGGSLGEVPIMALLIGGFYLLYKRIITWHIPISFIGAALAFSAIMWFVDPAKYANPVFHIMTGGLVLGAFFMATDYVTSPVTNKGMLIFGAGCGFLTIVIRLFGGYPEGVSFAILLMNLATPLIDKLVTPSRFGEAKANG